jgi:hypothetical protein
LAESDEVRLTLVRGAFGKCGRWVGMMRWMADGGWGTTGRMRRGGVRRGRSEVVYTATR